VILLKTVDRFLEYVSFDTQSKEDSVTYPSTDKQWILAHKIVNDLEKMGIVVSIDEFGYVIGKIPANTAKKAPRIAFIAHMDTSPDASGKDVKPRIVKAYDGKTILLNETLDIRLDPAVFETLKGNIGHDLIVTDGTTLLGADDKAGVAEIVSLAEYLTQNPAVPHGDVSFVFTPDEEIGRGTEKLDIKKVEADFAYTMDGSTVGEIAYENFNAAAAKVLITGKSVHPGSAKGKMLNSIRVAWEFDHLLPEFMRPEATEKYEGFNHVLGIQGSCEETVMRYIIRNHDRALFARQKTDFEHACAFINQKYGTGVCTLEIKDSYFNMREKIDHAIYVVDIAKAAIQECGVNVIVEPIRGGTDGARLTELGLPCPNLGTGGYNYHGPYEYCSIQEMNLAVEIAKKIVAKVAMME
jgi:tripeptide aminopeptidase